MKFQKIVCVDRTKLQDWALEELQGFSKNPIEVYDDYPKTKNEIISRLKGADAVLVSWHTNLDEEVIEACPHLKYIGMACSLYDDASANVAVSFARGKGITVTGIRDYGDPGVVEFIISELVRLLHGLGKEQWRVKSEELTHKKIGIIGLGTTGQLLAECLLPFGAAVYYYSRTRKKVWEEKGLTYLELKELLKTVDIISFHLPRNTMILRQEGFDTFGNGKILINTSLGLPFEEQAFNDWIRKEGNFAIFDADGKKELPPDLENFARIITAKKSAGWSAETEKRLSQKVLQNLKDYEEPSSV